MNTREAVIYVLKEEGISKYRMGYDLGVRPIMIDHYLNKSRMKQDTADKFEAKYNIHIDDVYNPTVIPEE